MKQQATEFLSRGQVRNGHIQSHVYAFRHLFQHPHGGKVSARTHPVPTHTAYFVLSAGVRTVWVTHVKLTDTMELNRYDVQCCIGSGNVFIMT